MHSLSSRTLRLLAALAALLPAVTAPAAAGVNRWTPIGPDGGTITALEAHPTRGNIVYAGTAGGVFKSTDSGTTWRLASRGLGNRRISALAVAPSNGAVVYAGALDQGVFSSTDGGASWRRGGSLFGSAVLSLGVDPRDARKVWAGTSTGVFRSTDGGATWTTTFAEELALVLDIEVDPLDANTLYVAGEGLEDDAGVSGVLKSTDGGDTWRILLDDAIFAESQIQIALDPTTPGLVYASTWTFGEQETWRSTDGGDTWQLTEGNYPLAVGPGGVVYAGDRRSDDHGLTWTPIAGFRSPRNPLLYAASAAPGTVWAGTEDDGVLRTRDAGASWQLSSRGLHATDATALAVDPERPRILYAATGSHFSLRTFRSQSSGAGWRPLGIPGDDLTFFSSPVLALDPQEPRTVYAAWRRHFARSDDGGDTWTLLLQRDPATGGFDPVQVLVDPTDSDIVYVTGTSLTSASTNCRLARSEDRGATFRCLPPFEGATSGLPSGFLPWLYADPARPGRLWGLASRDRFWRSDDRGTTWTAVRPRGLEGAGLPVSLTFDPIRRNRLYLTTQRQLFTDLPTRVWRSDDAGRTWTALGTGLPALSTVTDLRVDPRQPSLLYVVVRHNFDASRPEEDQSGVYWSRNGGRTWFPLINGLPRSVTGLVMDPRNPRQLYALTRNLGIYAFTRQ